MTWLDADLTYPPNDTPVEVELATRETAEAFLREQPGKRKVSVWVNSETRKVLDNVIRWRYKQHGTG